MSTMPTLFVRDVPPELYESLRDRARREGRSINAETIALLRRALLTARDEPPLDVLERLRRSREEFPISPEAPPPEQLIREDRDARSSGS